MAIITNLQPPAGATVTSDQPVTVDVIDPVIEELRVFMWVVFAATGAVELVYDGSSFTSLYSFSSVSSIVGGRQFSVVRVGGWPSQPGLRCDTCACAPAVAAVAAEGVSVLARNQTEVGPDNTVTETDLINYTIPADTLDIDGRRVVVKQHGTLYNNGGSRNVILRFYLDGVEVYRDTYALSNSVGRVRTWRMHHEIVSIGATEQQIRSSLVFNPASSADPDTGVAGGLVNQGDAYETYATSVADRTASAVFRVSAVLSAATSNMNMLNQLYQVSVE